MRTITFNVNQQKIKNIDSIAFVYGGTHNYLNLKFNFSDEWDGCFKAVSFVTDNKEIPFLLKDDSCAVPQEAFGSDTLTFYLVGKKHDYRIESRKFTIRLTKD